MFSGKTAKMKGLYYGLTDGALAPERPLEAGRKGGKKRPLTSGVSIVTTEVDGAIVAGTGPKKMVIPGITLVGLFSVGGFNDKRRDRKEMVDTGALVIAGADGIAAADLDTTAQQA